MIFTVINIGTGYLNRPNWLLAGYSVYHRVASQGFPAGFPAHNVYDRPRSRHQRRCVRDAHVFMTGPRPRSRQQQSRFWTFLLVAICHLSRYPIDRDSPRDRDTPRLRYPGRCAIPEKIFFLGYRDPRV